MVTNAAANEKDVPLVVDIDGTLLLTDLLAESFRLLMLREPLKALKGLSLRHNRASFKQYYAATLLPDMARMPVNAAMLDYVKQAKAQGRKVYLASASDHRLVQALADHMGLFDGIFASDGVTNLRAEAKAKALCDAFGEHGFDYAGNSDKDYPVWQKARGVIVAGTSASVRKEALRRFPHAQLVGEANRFSDYAKAMRVHQWFKNLLIIVPTIAAHMLHASQWIVALVAFLSFSLCASSVYLLNDWFDLDHDRIHPLKRRRMLASGQIPISEGTILIPVLLAGSLILGLFLPKAFLLVLGVYYLLTFSYSLWFKNQLLVDVVILACLYGIRIVSGGTLGIPLSDWLVVFSFFLFLSLAIIKRCAELINCSAEERGNPAGRGYLVGDTGTMMGMATASGYVAVLVLALYIQHPDVNQLYTHPKYLWAACVVFTYWISRVLLLTSRGQMNEDPVIFAMTDRVSWFCGFLLILLAWVSV
jgi:4-hydroxybenzoate polyprenyltransferase/phosphoserine phosphatase